MLPAHPEGSNLERTYWIHSCTLSCSCQPGQLYDTIIEYEALLDRAATHGICNGSDPCTRIGIIDDLCESLCERKDLRVILAAPLEGKRENAAMEPVLYHCS